MKRVLFFALIFLGTIVIKVSSENKKINKISTSTGNWKLIWNDEFNYIGLPDSTKWSYDTEGNKTGWGNDEKQYYTCADSSNVWVKDGKLSITARKNSIDGKIYTSARLLSKGNWLYGRFEIRAKLPTGKGTWPAIWMLPTDWEYGNWPVSGEIDIMENVGYNPDSVVGTVHLAKYNHTLGTQKSKSIFCPTSYKDFHVYALEWDENECRIYQDTTLYFTFLNQKLGYEFWPFDKQFHLLLNLAIGGTWGGKKGIDDNLFPHTFEIDYVRVYSK